MSGVTKPIDAFTSDDHSALIIVIAYSLASISVIAALIRFSLTLARKLPIGFDDGSYVLSNILAIVSSALLHLAAENGLAQYQSKQSEDRLHRFFKVMMAVYATEFFAMFFAKISLMWLIDTIYPRSIKAKAFVSLSLTAWLILALVAILPCHFSPPWTFSTSRCPADGNILYPVIVLNILSDVLLAIWIIPSVLITTLSPKYKAIVIFLFGIRALTIVPGILELILLNKYLHSHDQTWVTFCRVLLEQITVYVSVIGATLPRTNQFLSKLNSGRATLVLPPAQLQSAAKRPSQQQDPESKQSSLKLVPTYDNVLSTSVYSTRPRSPKALWKFWQAKAKKKRKPNASAPDGTVFKNMEVTCSMELSDEGRTSRSERSK